MHFFLFPSFFFFFFFWGGGGGYSMHKADPTKGKYSNYCTHSKDGGILKVNVYDSYPKPG